MKILYSFLLFAFASGEKFRFDNYTLYRIVPENVQQIKILQDLQNTDLSFDFWTDPLPTSEFVNVMSSPDKKTILEGFLNANDLKFEITMSNVQEAIDKENVKTYTRNSRSLTWDAYYQLNDIEAWMADLAATYPDIVTSFVGGTSYEGREIKGLKLSHGSGKRVIFIESGIHAREWITPTTACYIISQLLTSDDEEIMAAARNFDWYIIPVTNPDGYVWTHTDFRMWRKNRRQVTSTVYGVDLNRNWNSNFMAEGVSLNPDAQTYPGAGPFSEPETRTLSSFIRTIADSIDMYISFHSYSQLLLVPYGNTTDPLDNYEDAINIGRRAMGALSVRYGTQYVTGNIAEAIYKATGTSIDWVKESLRVPLVYCYELRDRGTNGFLLPADQILPNHLEVMDSVIELIHQAKRFGYMNSGSGLQASIVMVALIVLKFVL
ncbi:zinc carboxypeptidase-like [Pectinophora gossypiella]|uniref:zinc carboxypeptidase-like n=1 Tax=Pectinophora gossypiella TaxID=13191 RepID=UPI00214E8E3A|nr:zinc carboxypeptidase-like [Pectinophora gossypiella]